MKKKIIFTLLVMLILITTLLPVVKATDEVIEIDGYVFNSSDKENMTVGTNLEENVINLYYTKR